MSRYKVVVDSNDTLKQITRDGTLVMHQDGTHIPPWRTITGDEAERRFTQYQASVCRNMLRMLNDPRFAEDAQHVIDRIKERGTWIEPGE